MSKVDFSTTAGKTKRQVRRSTRPQSLPTQFSSWAVATMQKVVAQPHARAAVAVAVETFQKMTFHFEVIDEVQ